MPDYHTEHLRLKLFHISYTYTLLGLYHVGVTGVLRKIHLPDNPRSLVGWQIKLQFQESPLICCNAAEHHISHQHRGLGLFCSAWFSTIINTKWNDCYDLAPGTHPQAVAFCFVDLKPFVSRSVKQLCKEHSSPFVLFIESEVFGTMAKFSSDKVIYNLLRDQTNWIQLRHLKLYNKKPGAVRVKANQIHLEKSFTTIEKDAGRQKKSFVSAGR